jgi:alpha-amylase
LILLRSQGYPCIFFGDLYGIKGDENGLWSQGYLDKLPDLALARKLFAYGKERDYFDKRHCIG